EAILTSLGDAVLVVDRAGAPVLANAAYERMFGSGGAKFAPGNIRDIEGHPLPAAATPHRRAARGETFTMEFTLGGEDDANRYFEVTGKPASGAGADSGGVISIRDITERNLHRLQDEFLALASHELRTPLTPLTYYLSMANNLLADRPGDDRARHHLESAQHQVQRLTRLVGDLLDVHRLQSGKFNLEVGRVALDQVAARSVEVILTLIAEDAGQIIHLEAPETPLYIDGDATRLEQVVMNLLTNAITYAPRTPRIDVRVRRVGNEAELEVRDTGPGIPAAELSRIMSRFYQITRNDGDRPSRRGLGLGLYIANELVMAHGGRLEVTSVEAPSAGHGTTFTIHLPLAPDETREPPQKEPPRKERRRT
nr:PAS domain S-box protein [Ktedonobacterales bacterium]